jgi:two-component system, sensor histidine kinase
MKKRRNVRAILARTFIAAAVVPFVLMGGWGLNHARGQWHREGERLAEVAIQAGREVDDYLDHHRSALQTLADQLGHAAVPMDAAVTPWLRAVHDGRTGFLTMIAVDASGSVVAAVPRFVPGLDVSDRDYFTQLAVGRPWFVSGAFRGRGLGDDPIVAIAARIEDERGRFLGIVQGALSVDRFGQFEDRFASMPGLRVLVLDHESTVVYGGVDERFESLRRLADSELLRTSRSGTAPIYHDRAGNGRRWITTNGSSPRFGWQVVVMQPLRAATHDLATYVAGLIGAALWSLLIMAVLMRRSGRAVEPLERLAAVMRDFSVAVPHRPLDIPADAPAEIVDLARSFDTMVERTQLVITGLVPICALCKRIRTDEDDWEPVEAFVRARSQAEFTHGMCPECTETLGFPPRTTRDEQVIAESSQD